MKKFTLKISSDSTKDLTIIYKDGEDSLHEIKASKKEILSSLKYFERRSNEINITNIIYIEDKIPFDIFSNFISSIQKKEIEIDETNYQSYLYLSAKYEFKDLQEEIKLFSESRPDIKSIIDDLVQSNNQISQSQPPNTENDYNSEDYQLNSMREEIISQNLDICIQNHFLDQIPIQPLIRILNSPNRVIKDHHLLFSFIIEHIEKSEKVTLSENDRENVLLLPSALDYNEMSYDEVKKLIDLTKSENFFSPRNSESRIQRFCQTESETSARQKQLESQLEEARAREEEGARRIELLERQVEELKEAVEEAKRQIEACKEANERTEGERRRMSEKLSVIAVQCPYLNDGLNGIIKYLEGNSRNSETFEDVVKLEGAGNLSPTSPITNLIKYDSNNINECYYNYCGGKEATSAQGWIEFDFIERKINVTSYVLRNDTPGSSNPRSWQIAGSNDQNKWDTLSRVADSQAFINASKKLERFQCEPSSNYYRYIRYMQEDSSAGSSWKYSICLTCIEFFGSVI